MMYLRSLSLYVALIFACASLSFAAKAQPQDLKTPQDQSVVDAARRSREQKKNARKQPRVITNEDLETQAPQKTGAPDEGLVVTIQVENLGGTSANKESGSADKKSEAAAAEDADIARLKGQVAEAERTENLQRQELELDQLTIALNEEIAALKEQVIEAERELNLQRREFALDQQTIYSNPLYLTTHAGKEKLDSDRQRMNERQLEIEGLKEHYADLRWRQWQLKQAATPDRSVPPPDNN